ncbi:hypothetical protein [Haliea sp.]|uniref:hypothetical protein n=1 Tax=Haliea sp. TaxID=1932666 RepID=UPI003527ECC8
MHQRLSGRRRSRRANAGSGNLWLRSDLRAPAAPQGRREPGTNPRPVVRSWMTWTLFGALLVTTAAAGHGFLATEPVVASPTRTATAISEASPVLQQPIARTLPALYALEDTQQQLITQVEEIQASNRALLSRLESLQAALAPDDAGTAAH